MDLTMEQKAEIFDVLYLEYVERHGLGGMAKADFDALFVYLFVTNGTEINSFVLSNEFKITESRVKSLLERAAVKFDHRTKEEAWCDLLNVFERVEYDIESMEKGQMRFQLSDPMLFRWLQDQVRTLGSTCSYHKSSEQVSLNLETLYQIMDFLWKEKGVSESWTGEKLINAQERIKAINKKIGDEIKINFLEDLRAKKQPKLMKALQIASNLIEVGFLVTNMINEIIFKN